MRPMTCTIRIYSVRDSSHVRSKGGFTLVELTIAVAVVGILALVAYPTFIQQMQKSRRSDAIAALTDLAYRLERYYSEKNTFATATIASGSATDVLGSPNSPSGFYTLSIVSSQTSDTTYLIQATRKAGGPQASDATCGDFTLTNATVRGISGSGSINDCWLK